MTQVLEFDVVVVGAGLAGLASALTVAETGASVCLLEKAAEIGGSSVRSGGGLLFAGTPDQEAVGAPDSPGALREALVKTGQGKGVPEVIDAYVNNQLETYEWLRDTGLKIELAPAFPPGETPRAHMTGKGVITGHLYERANAAGVTFEPNADVVRLCRNHVGRVDGVHAVVAGSERTYTARRGVVLATGGFARNQELLETFAPQWVGTVALSGKYSDGSGLRMAWAIGADLANMAYVEGSFGASIAKYPDLSTDTDEILLYPNRDGAILVNLNGERFASEALGYKVLGPICMEQPKGVAFSIFDEAVMERSNPVAVPMDYRAAFARGLIKRADTLADLAEILEIDPVALEKTVSEYNAAVDAHVDAAFGRPLDGGAEAGIRRIERAPFYGYPTRAGLTSTFAGLRVDGTMRVLDVFGDPIPGLYAAGEVVGGLHGAGYYPAAGLGSAGVFGRVAGRQVAAEVG